jgi:glycogen(starch) synthase
MPRVTGRRTWLVGLTEYAGLTDYTGGIGTHFSALLPALVRMGIDVELVLFTEEALDPHLRPPGGVDLLGVHGSGHLPATVQLFHRAMIFRRYARRRHYDAVFLPEWAAIAALLPRASPLVTNLATGIRLGDWISHRTLASFPPRMRLSRWLQDRLETRQIRRSRGVVSISDAVLAWNRTRTRGLPAARVVGNCVDTPRIQSESATAPLPPGWPRESPDRPGQIILFAGRLEYRKGVMVAMEAFAEVLKSHPHAVLVLSGASGDRRFEPTRQYLLSRIPPPFRPQVVFTGHVAGESLYASMHAADVVMCPSLWEGFGNVALEVKAVGTPLVVTAGSGFDDFCQDEIDSLTVAPDDVDALAGALVRILDSPELGRHLVTGAMAGLSRYSADSIAARLGSAVTCLLGGADSR